MFWDKYTHFEESSFSTIVLDTRDWGHKTTYYFNEIAQQCFFHNPPCTFVRRVDLVKVWLFKPTYIV